MPCFSDRSFQQHEVASRLCQTFVVPIPGTSTRSSTGVFTGAHMARSWTSQELDAAALLRLVCQPVSAEMITHISNVAAGILYCNPIMKCRQHGSRRVLTTLGSQDILPPLYEFISALTRAATVPTATLLSALVYLTRLRLRLSADAFYGVRCTAHRIFLSALILTSKYLNDQSPSNKKWAQFCNESAGSSSFILSSEDISGLEKQTLELLDYNLAITEEDLYLALRPFLRPV